MPWLYAKENNKLLSLEEKRELQLVELEILCLFQKLCIEHKLRFFLTAGSLLGAVRHGGFIPWDDDIDVVMFRDDFDRFQKYVVPQLPQGYFYQDSSTDKNYPFYFAKLRKDETEVIEPLLEGVSIHSGVYIDIFPLDCCPKSDKLAVFYFKLMDLFTTVLRSKSDSLFVCGYSKWYANILFRLCGMFPKAFVVWTRETTRKLVDFFSKSNKICTVGGSHGYPKESYERVWFQREESRSFEGREFPVPCEWHHVLSRLYGNYMDSPEVEEQNGHFISICLKKGKEK